MSNPRGQGPSWGTDIKYLNDAQELKYSAGLMAEIFHSLAQELPDLTEEERRECGDFFTTEGPDPSRSVVPWTKETCTSSRRLVACGSRRRVTAADAIRLEMGERVCHLLYYRT